jgi:hypothetical protein
MTHFSHNFVKYDGKTNRSVLLEDYCLACWAGGVDGNHFIIEFLPIYLADMATAWLDHLSRNMIDSWEDLKEIHIDNFQGMYCGPATPRTGRVASRSRANPSRITVGASP